MDGFRERLGGRFDRTTERGSMNRGGMDRSSQERYERPVRRGTSAGYGTADSMDADAIAEVIDASNAKQLGIISEYFEEAKDDRMESEKEILRALDENTQLLEGFRVNTSRHEPVPAPVQVPAVDAAAKEEILQALQGNTSLLNVIHQEISAKAESVEVQPAEVQSEQTEQADVQKLEAALDTYFKNMEDHVHKENVKCYRNVQAAITEQNTAALEQSKKNLGALKVFAIITMVLSVVNIGLLAAFIFGVI